MNRLSEMSMKRGLTIVLIAQALVAGLVLVSDIEARWIPRLTQQDTLPSGPVSPGDQVRRFDPSRTQPGFTGPGALPDINLPDDPARRLVFEVTEIGGLGEHLLIHGGIEPGDADRFRAFLANQPDLSVPVAFHSPGGVVMDALAIGRLLRDRELKTAVLPGMACVSACPYMLAGGVERLVSREGAVGLHQHYYDTPGFLPAFLAVEDVQRGQGETMEFLIEMGVDPGIMIYSLNTPPDDIYVLVEDELTETRIATEVTD